MLDFELTGMLRQLPVVLQIHYFSEGNSKYERDDRQLFIIEYVRNKSATV